MKKTELAELTHDILEPVFLLQKLNAIVLTSPAQENGDEEMEPMTDPNAYP